MRQLCVTIPDGVEFSDLCMSRDVDDGQVLFKVAPIEAICEASALDLGEILQGPPDPVQEDLMEEVRLQEAHGGGFSYPPGHA